MPDPALQREFWAALAEGDGLRVRRLLEAGVDVNAPIGNPGGETPLIRAAAAGDLDMVRLLVNAGADVNQPWKGPRSWTPLMFAHNHPAVLRELIEAGADLLARTTAHWTSSSSGGKTLPGGETALHLAAAAGNVDTVRLLLQAGAEVEARTDDGRAPLDYAIALGSVTEAAEALVESGAELTPQRLETMHSSAHRPDSDIVAFPIITNSNGDGSNDQAGPTRGPGRERDLPPAKPASAFRCPSCHSLIYSRKPKLCGQCGATLPAELLLSEQQAHEQAKERQWARALADKFDPQDSPTRGGPPTGVSALPPDTMPAGTLSAEALLRRVSCAEEFRHRDRPDFWLYVLGYTFALSVIIYLLLHLGVFRLTVVLPFVVLFLLHGWFAWQRSSPICPNCHQNIRYCSASFCHVCGQPLKNRRCEGCGVDNSWLRFLRPYSSIANFRWITFCPGCGAHLETRVSRWRANC